jgi:DNA modification methylase
MSHFDHKDGALLRSDVTEQETVVTTLNITGGPVPLIMADPPYGEITAETWDQSRSVTGLQPGSKEAEAAFIDWMLSWTRQWSTILEKGGAFYVWGGVGKPGFRPFYGYLNRVERETGLTLAMPITWKKKRAYGVQYNYLFTREELAYLCKGDPKKPRCFHVPLTDRVRGYQGYSAKYKAKSDLLRRTNVWEEDGQPNPVDDVTAEEFRMCDVWDETEILRGKRHECEKAKRVIEVPIEVHTEPGEFVVDLFSGSGSCSEAARRLGRRWVAIERDAAMVAAIDQNMKR